jgi:hypothetical protein
MAPGSPSTLLDVATRPVYKHRAPRTLKFSSAIQVNLLKIRLGTELYHTKINYSSDSAFRLGLKPEHRNLKQTKGWTEIPIPGLEFSSLCSDFGIILPVDSVLVFFVQICGDR